MIPINAYGNCNVDLLGTGLRSCFQASWGDVIGFNTHPKNFSKTITTDTITEQSWKNDMKEFDVIPFVGIYDFAQNTPENEVATSSTGVETTIRLGKPNFTFMFTKGGCFHKALFDKRGFGRWDVSLIFENGILFALNQNETAIEGFDMGRFDVPTFRLQQGTDPQQSSAIMQFIDAIQFNSKNVFLTWDKLGVNLSKIGGVVDTDIAYPSAPTAGTSITVKVTSRCNGDDVILGLDDEALWALGGTQTSATTISSVAYNADTSDYTITVTPTLVATDTIAPYLTDGTYNVVEDDLGGMYKGKAAIATV